MNEAYAKGRRDYEADVRRCPLYHDRTPRKRWDQLAPVMQWSWARHALQPFAS